VLQLGDAGDEPEQRIDERIEGVERGHLERLRGRDGGDVSRAFDRRVIRQHEEDAILRVVRRLRVDLGALPIGVGRCRVVGCGVRVERDRTRDERRRVRLRIEVLSARVGRWRRDQKMAPGSIEKRLCLESSAVPAFIFVDASRREAPIAHPKYRKSSRSVGFDRMSGVRGTASGCRIDAPGLGKL